MTQESKGLFIPYPLLSILVTIILVVVGGLIGLFVQVNTLNSTMIMRDADRAAQVKLLSDQVGLWDLKMDNAREKIAKLEGALESTATKKGKN